MKHRRAMRLVGAAIGIVVLTWIGLRHVSLRALDEPGRAETYLATKAKPLLVGREARYISRLEPANLSQSVMIGGMHFRARCASCHGLDARTPSDIGSAMYPRASGLGSAEVQRCSDAELFWIIQNGIRLTGMPGFGKSLSDGEIWPLVDDIRSVQASRTEQKGVASPGTPLAENHTERRWRLR